MRPADIIEPVGAVEPRCRARAPETLRVRLATATVPRRTECERKHAYRRYRPPFRLPRRCHCRQDQTRHVRLLATARYGFISVGFQRHRRSLVSLRAAPPAVDRVVAAEIFLVRDDGLAEFGQRESASQDGFVASPQVFLPDRAQFVVESRNRRPRTERKPIEQVTAVPHSLNTCVRRTLRKMEERINVAIIRSRSSPACAFPSRRVPLCWTEAPRAS